MREGIGWGLFIVAVFVIAIMASGKKKGITIFSPKEPKPDTDEIKCELKDAYGRIVTITGKEGDPQFERLCKQQTNQQVYVYGYPYYFIRWWRPRPTPPPPPPPMPPAT